MCTRKLPRVDDPGEYDQNSGTVSISEHKFYFCTMGPGPPAATDPAHSNLTSQALKYKSLVSAMAILNHITPHSIHHNEVSRLPHRPRRNCLRRRNA